MSKGIALVKLPINSKYFYNHYTTTGISDNKRAQMLSLSTEWVRWLQVHIRNLAKSKINNPPTWRKEKNKGPAKLTPASSKIAMGSC